MPGVEPSTAAEISAARRRRHSLQSRLTGDEQGDEDVREMVKN
jgi:hypothetical protein